jgi:hypothetical protein
MPTPMKLKRNKKRSEKPNLRDWGFPGLDSMDGVTGEASRAIEKILQKMVRSLQEAVPVAVSEVLTVATDEYGIEVYPKEGRVGSPVVFIVELPIGAEYDNPKFEFALTDLFADTAEDDGFDPKRIPTLVKELRSIADKLEGGL